MSFMWRARGREDVCALLIGKSAQRFSIEDEGCTSGGELADGEWLAGKIKAERRFFEPSEEESGMAGGTASRAALIGPTPVTIIGPFKLPIHTSRTRMVKRAAASQDPASVRSISVRDRGYALRSQVFSSQGIMRIRKLSAKKEVIDTDPLLAGYRQEIEELKETPRREYEKGKEASPPKKNHRLSIPRQLTKYAVFPIPVLLPAPKSSWTKTQLQQELSSAQHNLNAPLRAEVIEWVTAEAHPASEIASSATAVTTLLFRRDPRKAKESMFGMVLGRGSMVSPTVVQYIPVAD
ncbi:hypothetical protein DFH94DRAFT_846429 [Russula ochroleuca]|uniref:Uncharacterized protein n=1 Tax=Russula ochroleuca TaxID=152965 RepID=A0A9P5MRS6_9AGAM|nr:hypothetical protein DFH94DRAFT_846429 [Russula ochroleuca]